jgi:hypothetical protein
MALLVVIAVMTGLQRDLQAKILTGTPHIYIYEQGTGIRLGNWRGGHGPGGRDAGRGGERTHPAAQRDGGPDHRLRAAGRALRHRAGPAGTPLSEVERGSRRRLLPRAPRSDRRVRCRTCCWAGSSRPPRHAARRHPDRGHHREPEGGTRSASCCPNCASSSSPARQHRDVRVRQRAPVRATRGRAGPARPARRTPSATSPSMSTRPVARARDRRSASATSSATRTTWTTGWTCTARSSPRSASRSSPWP